MWQVMLVLLPCQSFQQLDDLLLLLLHFGKLLLIFYALLLYFKLLRFNLSQLGGDLLLLVP